MLAALAALGSGLVPPPLPQAWLIQRLAQTRQQPDRYVHNSAGFRLNSALEEISNASSFYLLLADARDSVRVEIKIIIIICVTDNVAF